MKTVKLYKHTMIHIQNLNKKYVVTHSCKKVNSGLVPIEP